MVGYGEDTKGYKIFYTSTHKIFIERSVQFEEDIILDFELAPDMMYVMIQALNFLIILIIT